MPNSFIIREGIAADLPGIMRLKLELAISDGIAYTVRATPADWERDGFGPDRRFTVFIAEQAGRIVGIAICGDRYFPGWVGPTIALLDLCVESQHRNRGVGTALLARVAEFAKAHDCVMIELTMRAGNRAAALYERVGFAEVPDIRNYVIAGDALDRLASAGPAPTRMAG